MGIFAGSGVGKSTLLAMMARNSKADAIVIGLIGERGREVKEFIEDDLGPEGLARSVVVAATSDEAPLVRRQAAYVAMTRGRAIARPGPERAAADGFGDPLRHGPARDRPFRRRAARLQRLHAHRLRRTAAASGARRSRPARRQPARSPACLPFWWKATITTNRSPMRCAASWTAISCWTVPLRNGAAFPPSMS